MDARSIASPHPFGLLLHADARREGWISSIRAGVSAGALVKIRPGVYLTADSWEMLSPTDRHLVRIHATRLTLSRTVFARESAAVIHGLPLVGTMPSRVHLLQSTSRGSGTRAGVTIHAYSGDPDIVARGTLLVTGPCRTVLDLARVLPHHEALAIADASLRFPASGGTSGSEPMCTRSGLIERAGMMSGDRGAWAAYSVVNEADPLAGSVGESYARSLMIRMGAPRPELQVRFRDEQGVVGDGDFYWREYGIIGEFDGKLKYGADNPSGLTPAEVVYREKLREDRLRRLSAGFVRFGWADLRDPTRLAHLLRRAGVPLDRRSAWPEFRPLVRAGG